MILRCRSEGEIFLIIHRAVCFISNCLFPWGQVRTLSYTCSASPDQGKQFLGAICDKKYHWKSLGALAQSKENGKIVFYEVRPDIEGKCKKLSIFRCRLFKLVAIVDLLYIKCVFYRWLAWFVISSRAHLGCLWIIISLLQLKCILERRCGVICPKLGQLKKWSIKMLVHMNKLILFLHTLNRFY